MNIILVNPVKGEALHTALVELTGQTQRDLNQGSISTHSLLSLQTKYYRHTENEQEMTQLGQSIHVMIKSDFSPDLKTFLVEQSYLTSLNTSRQLKPHNIASICPQTDSGPTLKCSHYLAQQKR